MADNRIHYQPCTNNGNVRCLNGNAHRRSTLIKEDVTCEECLKGLTQGYWDNYFANETQDCGNCRNRKNCKN